MFCAKCGNKIEEGNLFCAVCGTPVPQAKKQVQPITQPVQQVQQVTQPVQPQTVQSVKPVQSKPSKNKETKKTSGSKKKIAIIATASALVLAGGIGTAAALKNRTPGGDDISYFKGFEEDDVVFPDDGEAYVDNQLLVEPEDDTKEAEVKSALKDFDGKIVGFNAITKVYQVEFPEKWKDEYDSLEDLADDIMDQKCIRKAELNYVYYNEALKGSADGIDDSLMGIADSEYNDDLVGSMTVALIGTPIDDSGISTILPGAAFWCAEYDDRELVSLYEWESYVTRSIADGAKILEVSTDLVPTFDGPEGIELLNSDAAYFINTFEDTEYDFIMVTSIRDEEKHFITDIEDEDAASRVISVESLEEAAASSGTDILAEGNDAEALDYAVSIALMTWTNFEELSAENIKDILTNSYVDKPAGRDVGILYAPIATEVAEKIKDMVATSTDADPLKNISIDEIIELIKKVKDDHGWVSESVSTGENDTVLQDIISGSGYTDIGTFNGNVIVNENNYWTDADFGYNSTGLLAARRHFIDGQEVIIAIENTGSSNQLYVISNGNYSTSEIKFPEYWENTDPNYRYFYISNAIASTFYGEEGFSSIQTYEKDGKVYLFAEQHEYFNDWGPDKGYTPETNNMNYWSLYEITPDGAVPLYSAKYYLGGMDGVGGLLIYDSLTESVINSFHYGDLEEDASYDDHFEEDYISAINEIGFPELHSYDAEFIYGMTLGGILPGDEIAGYDWNCNTDVEMGDTHADLNVYDNTTGYGDFPYWRTEGTDDTSEEETESEEASEPSNSVDFAADEAMYGPVLASIKSAIENQSDIDTSTFEMEYDGQIVDSLYAFSGDNYNSLSDAYYWFDDLDKDGTDELIYGEPYEYDDGSKGYDVEILIAKTDTGYKCVILETYFKSGCSYIGNGIFSSGSVSGAMGTCYDSLYRYENSELKEFVFYYQESLFDDSAGSFLVEGDDCETCWDNSDRMDDPNYLHGDDAQARWDECVEQYTAKPHPWDSSQMKLIADY